MKVALVGAGRIGGLHARVLAGHPAVSELLVADADRERARALAAELGATAVDDVADALDWATAVVIAAATDAHPGLVRAGLARRLPVFVEKPLALDLEETIHLVEEIEASGIAVQLGFQRRFDPAYAEARRLIEAGVLGELYLVRLIAHDANPPPEAYIPTSGGMFRDSSIHDFDAIRWLTGVEVEEVFALGSVRGFEMFARHGDVDTVAAVLRLADGTLGVLGATRHNPRGYDIRMEVVGSADAVSMGAGPRTASRSLEPGADGTGPGWESFLTRFEPAYRAELEAFIAVAGGHRPSPCTARDGLEAMRIAMAATRSLAEHRPIGLAEIPGGTGAGTPAGGGEARRR